MEEGLSETIEQAAAGDVAAFEAIYRNLAGFVYAVALRTTRNEQDAQEVTQDVFMKLHQNLKDFRGESSLRTWVYRITVNEALNACRARNRHFRKRVEMDEQTLEQQVDPHTLEAGPDVEPGVTRQLDKYLAVLNPDQRACLILRKIQGLSYEEIAAALNIPINTVRSRLKRAREALFDANKKEQDDAV